MRLHSPANLIPLVSALILADSEDGVVVPLPSHWGRQGFDVGMPRVLSQDVISRCVGHFKQTVMFGVQVILATKSLLFIRGSPVMHQGLLNRHDAFADPSHLVRSVAPLLEAEFAHKVNGHVTVVVG